MNARVCPCGSPRFRLEFCPQTLAAFCVTLAYTSEFPPASIDQSSGDFGRSALAPPH